MKRKVLVTDYAWPSLEIERGVLAPLDIELVVAETGSEDELTALASQAEAILTCWKAVTPAVLDAAPQCKIVSRYGIGLDNIAVEHATQLGILVTNVPDFCLDEVSDHVMALLLASARGIVRHARATRQGIWDLKRVQPIPRLRGQTLGLIGYGNIARALAPKALAFGMQLLAYTPRLTAGPLPGGATATRDLDHLLRTADFISIHVPLSDETRGLIDARALALMKPSAVLINSSRGPVINEQALLQALRDGQIAGAALDVLSQEPPDAGDPLLALENVIVTPHSAFYSESAIAELAYGAAEHVAQALSGATPSNIVNPAVWAQPACRFPRSP